jgi:phosphatidate cytidylyltransferase
MTALWLAPLAFGLIFGLEAQGFSLALAALLLVGAWEFQRLAGLAGSVAGWALIASQALVFLLLLREQAAWLESPLWLLTGACAAWLVMFLRLFGFRPQAAMNRRYRAISFICALLSLTGAWAALTWLRQLEQGAWWIVTLLLIIWAADIGAYFTGRAFGQRKLAPRISPGKTLAGLYGGLIAAAITGWAALHWLPTPVKPGMAWVGLSVLTALVSVGGDLFISLHKRMSGHKDAGRIFPGHGGVLDRLDSLLAGAPFFALGALLMGGH